MGIITAKGQHATVTFDGDVITIVRTAMAVGGRGTATYPLANLSGVEVKMPGRLTGGGVLTLVLPGGVQARRDADLFAKYGDPLKVTFLRGRSSEFQVLTDAVRAALTAKFTTGPTTAEPTAPSLTDQLERLAKLRADGVLSEEEFAAAKLRLLKDDE